MFAGDSEVSYESNAETVTQRGVVVTLVKPDGTVLVHDADGYQPAAWLTRADTVQFSRDGRRATLLAGSGDARLRVETSDLLGSVHYAVSPAGPALGACPDCGGSLVRDGARVVCTGCLAAHRVPREATVLEEACPVCGWPRMTLVRGVEVTVCVDRDCEPIADAVAAAVDWRCPDCGDPLDVRYDRGLRAACEACGHRFPVPAAPVAGTCDCGLPRFGPPADRCLNPSCRVDGA